MTAKTDADREAVAAKIAGLPALGDVAARLHEVIVAAAPELHPRLWYGMPGYAKAPKSPVLCFFRVDNDRFVTLGLTEHATHEVHPERGDLLMESAWFLSALDPATERTIGEIVARATA